VADIADIANDRVEQHLAAALGKAVGKSAPESHPDFDGENCVACIEPIPAARLALGKVRCVACQATLESRRRRGLV
jgi:RNA polymerase-binding transcription factor DksA